MERYTYATYICSSIMAHYSYKEKENVSCAEKLPHRLRTGLGRWPRKRKVGCSNPSRDRPKA